MTEFDRFKRALAQTESGDFAQSWGDAGRACGRWQMHPDWFSDYRPTDAIVGETWDEWFGRALQVFWLRRRSEVDTVLKMAEIFHLGYDAWKRGDHDDEYLYRFQRHWLALAPATPKTTVS